MERRRNVSKIFIIKSEGKDNMGNIGIYVRITLKSILE